MVPVASEQQIIDSILAAVSPHHAVLYLSHAGSGIAFAVLGAAVLASAAVSHVSGQAPAAPAAAIPPNRNSFRRGSGSGSTSESGASCARP